MNKRDENKIYNWERERSHGKWIYALINSALTAVTLYAIFGALNFGKIINITFLTFERGYFFILPVFAIMYVVFLIYYSRAEEEYQQLLKYKKQELESNQTENYSIE